MKIAYLNISKYGHHFYGHVTLYGSQRECLKYPLSESEAISLNKTDSWEEKIPTYEAGVLSERFFSRKSLEEAAIKYVEENNIDLLLIGPNLNVYEPKRVLYGPVPLKDKLNLIFDGYFGSKEKDEWMASWYEIFKDL